MTKFDVLVIGAGINGLAAAYHLSNRKDLKIGLIEQFSLGHSYGSSHGFSRIFRTTYVNPTYTKLARRADFHEWPSLEEQLGSKLLHPNSRCLFGSGAFFERYIEAILESHSDLEVELLGVSAARQRFPQFNFFDSLNVLHDYSSKVIAAEDTMKKLAKVIIERNVAIFNKTKVFEINSDVNEIRLETTRGPLNSERLIIAAGPWIRHLLPELDTQFRPIKQTVGYYRLEGASEQYQIGRFPNWVYFGEGKNNDFYGLPEFGCKGIKVAQELTEGEIDDPDVTNSEPDKERIRILENFVKKHFVKPIINTERVETCFYTNTGTNDFVLDFLPQDHRIVIGSACSGHAFKFAPLTGRILSELALDGKTTIPEFEENRGLFSLKNNSSFDL